MNNSTQTPIPTFYEFYKSRGICPELLAIGTLRFLLAIAAVTFNMALVYVTIRSRYLRSRCNFLIGFDSACSVATFFTNIPPFFIVLSGQNFIPLRICFWIQLISAIGINLLLGAMLAVGLDRLISVVAPVWMSMMNYPLYLFLLIFGCCIYAGFALSLLYPVSLVQNPEKMVPCSLGDLYIGTVGQQLFYNAMIFTGLTVACYVLIWLIFQIRKCAPGGEIKPEIDYTRRLFRSLAVIVSLVSAGYFLNSMFLLSLPYLGLSPVNTVFASYLLHLVTDLTGAINAPVLYLLSTEYRKAFDEVFGRTLIRWKFNTNNQNSVGSRNPNPNPESRWNGPSTNAPMIAVNVPSRI